MCAENDPEDAHDTTTDTVALTVYQGKAATASCDETLIQLLLTKKKKNEMKKALKQQQFLTYILIVFFFF